ncbi:hypothetical protein BSKO_13027 [Bryopsis sp. KO-2023]|nr:hypothetical protein BSKO_13027 [Bryopsis sp. KO-2023]
MLATMFAILHTNIHLILVALGWTVLECCLATWWRQRRGNPLATKEQELRSWAEQLKKQETLLKTRQMKLYREQEEIKADMEEMRITMSGQLAQERESLQEWDPMNTISIKRRLQLNDV